MAVILGDACSGAPLREVAAVPDDIVYAVFGNELSMGKSMGLMGMVAMMRSETKRQLRAIFVTQQFTTFDGFPHSFGVNLDLVTEDETAICGTHQSR